MSRYHRVADYISIHGYIRAYVRALYLGGIQHPFKFIKRIIEFAVGYLKLKATASVSTDFRLAACSPELWDMNNSSGDFGMYCYQDSWAFEHLVNEQPDSLVDIASSTYFLAFAAKITNVISIDIRELNASLPTIEYRKGDITNLPFSDNSIHAISTLSVIEHIGLGRYGDNLDINGMETGIKELIRVLKPGGMLLVAFPVGKTNMICFNAHRICTPEKVFALFSDLELVDEKYALPDNIVSRNEYESLDRPYAYGCYRFTKRPHN